MMMYPYYFCFNTASSPSELKKSRYKKSQHELLEFRANLNFRYEVLRPETFCTLRKKIQQLLFLLLSRLFITKRHKFIKRYTEEIEIETKNKMCKLEGQRQNADGCIRDSSVRDYPVTSSEGNQQRTLVFSRETLMTSSW